MRVREWSRRLCLTAFERRRHRLGQNSLIEAVVSEDGQMLSRF